MRHPNSTATKVTLIAGLMATGAAQAGTVALNYQDAFHGGYVTTAVSTNGNTTSTGGPTYQNTLTGGLKFETSHMIGDPEVVTGSILAWCIEIAQTTASGGERIDYTTSTLAAQTWVGSLQKLINQRFKEVMEGTPGENTKMLSAAMQLAVWELVTDKRPGNLSDGNLRVQQIGTDTASLSARSVAKAQEWLSTLGTAQETGNYRIVVLKNDVKQDQITVSAVPLPGASFLLGSALLGFMTISRRSKV